MSIYKIIEELSKDNSRLAKEAILEREKNNPLLKIVLFSALDPLTQYYQRKIPEYVSNGNDYNLIWGIEQLAQLSTRVYTGNKAIDFLTHILESVSSDDALVIERIIEKDLKCGVSTSTVNKIWPELVSEYPIMLCSKFEQKLVDKMRWPAIAQVKSDGMRFNAIIRNGAVEYYSRNGKELFLHGKLDSEFLKLAAGENIVFDGELRVFDKDAETLTSRKEGNGILNKANKGTISEAEADRVVGIVWDYIPYADFKKEIYNDSYENKFNSLDESLKLLNLTKIQLIPSRIVANQKEAQEYFTECRLQGEEGIILKDMTSTWSNTRSKSHIKFKAEEEADLLITAIEEGTGKYKGMLGAVVCETSDGKIKVNCGSGFDDKQRKEYFNKETVGKIVTVKYNEKIQSKDGSWSLFLPIFVEIRTDKDKANTFDELK